MVDLHHIGHQLACPDTLSYAVTIDARPAVRLAIRAAIDDRDFSIAHVGRWTAIHLYDYCGTVQIGRRRFDIRPGDLTITPAGTTARYHVDGPATHLVVHYVDTPQSGHHVGSTTLQLHYRLGANRYWAQSCLQRVVELHARASEAVAMAAAEAALHHLLLWLATLDDDDGTSPTDQAVQAAADYLDERFGERVTVNDVAVHVGLSRNHLARRFRARFGVTMQQHLLARRIEVAQQLLTGTNLAIGAVGRRVGIPDPQYFNKTFRAQVGTSPSRYRQRDADAIQAPPPRDDI